MTTRIVFASDTSGHTMGYHVVARGLRDAGFEVIMTGRQLPAEAASSALDEDAEIVAYRVMDRDPVEVVGALLEALRDRGIGDRPVLVGGIISRADADKLREAGVAGVFGPGSKLRDIAECARTAVAATGGAPT
ncbi:MAG: cobalamin B12-binding domain-containing protein [Chloroflexi bacterium]|nr:cobalamin B12-binding domain-containing protein [Chloroflexota bacterium]